MEWQEYKPSNRPPKAGYYLITWKDGSSRVGKDRKRIRGNLWVSEAWYNSDALVPWWWSRRYTGMPHLGIEMAIRHEVLAWMELPKPYREGSNDNIKTDKELSDEFGELIAEMAIRTEKTEQQVMYELARNYWDIVPFEEEKE